MGNSTSVTKESNALRLGILGTSRIAPKAVLKPAAESSNVTVVAVASRDATKGMHTIFQKHSFSFRFTRVSYVRYLR